MRVVELSMRDWFAVVDAVWFEVVDADWFIDTGWFMIYFVMRMYRVDIGIPNW